METELIKKSASYVEKLLLESGVVTENQMLMAVATAELKSNFGVTDAIAHLGFASEIDVMSIVAKDMGFSEDKILVNLPRSDYRIVSSFAHNLVENVSRSRAQCLFGVDFENKVVKIAVTDVLDNIGRDYTFDFYEGLGYSIDFFVTTKLSLALMQKSVYKNTSNYKEDFYSYIGFNQNMEEGINSLISVLFEYAALERSSDIYFDVNKMGDDELSHIFFRIDRKKRYQLSIPSNAALRLSQAIKQRSGIEAGRLKGHQDGSMEVRILENQYLLSVRVNTISTVSGEQITMRLQMEERHNLADLGFRKDHLDKAKKVISGLKGIIVVIGVTGSGKTTTLYSMLSELDFDAYNIITMEDPVEIRMKGLNQVQISDDAEQGWSETIRACLRQAPDVVLMGEIRDAETAQRAVEMSLTGHLVLTTIHANSIDSITERLKDLGVHNVDSFVNAVELAIHQELVAKDGGGMRLKYEIAFKGLKGMEFVDEC